MIATEYPPLQQQLNNNRKRSRVSTGCSSASAMNKTAKTSSARTAPSSSSSSSSRPIIFISKRTTSSAAAPPVKKTKNSPTLLVEEPSPVTFLFNLLSKSEHGRRILSTRSLSSSSTWQRPSQEALDAYDLEVVNAIREGDVPALRRMNINFQQQQRGKGGTCMNACNKFGESILSMACRRGHVETVQFLVVEAQVDVHLLRDDFGRRPHHDTCWTASLNDQVMDILLFGAAATHAPTTTRGVSASSSSLSLSPVELLLEKDVRGHTPFHYARREHWDDWVRFLEQRSEKLLQPLEVHQDASTTTAAPT